MDAKVNVITTVKTGWFSEKKQAVMKAGLEAMSLPELLFHALMGDGRTEQVGA
jgi:hypothetical protein